MRILIGSVRWIDICDHHQIAIALKGASEQMSQFGIPVLDIPLYSTAGQRIYAVGQREERLIDARALLQTCTPVVGGRGALRPGQIYQ